jgi:hypothetical protein
MGAGEPDPLQKGVADDDRGFALIGCLQAGRCYY